MPLTDKQRLLKLNELEQRLKLTTRGYAPLGVHWRTSMAIIDELQKDALGDSRPVPQLGPAYQGGKSILQEDCTHITGGLGWPAFDTAFGAGTVVIAPEDLTITDDTSSAQGGDAFYARGRSGIEYWFGHITNVPKKGTKFEKGDRLTTTSAAHARPHLHLGLDCRKLNDGRHLISHTDYTHGAPTIGAQLAAEA